MTSGNKLSRIIAVLLCIFISFGIVAFVPERKEVQAAAKATFKYAKKGNGEDDNWGDGCNFIIEISGVSKGTKVTIRLEAEHEIGGYNIWAPDDAKVTKDSDMVLKIAFTYKGKNVQGQITGYNITERKPKLKNNLCKVATT